MCIDGHFIKVKKKKHKKLTPNCFLKKKKEQKQKPTRSNEKINNEHPKNRRKRKLTVQTKSKKREKKEEVKHVSKQRKKKSKKKKPSMLVNRERKKNQRKKKAKHTSKQRKNKIKEKWKKREAKTLEVKSNVRKYFWKFILWAFSYQFFLNFRKKILRSYHLFFFILIQPNTLPKQNKKKKILIFSPKFSLHHVSPLNKHTPKS